MKFERVFERDSSAITRLIVGAASIIKGTERKSSKRPVAGGESERERSCRSSRSRASCLPPALCLFPVEECAPHKHSDCASDKVIPFFLSRSAVGQWRGRGKCVQQMFFLFPATHDSTTAAFLSFSRCCCCCRGRAIVRLLLSESWRLLLQHSLRSQAVKHTGKWSKWG